MTYTPNPFLDSLELSTRASNVLRDMGVDDLEKFLNVRRADVFAQRNAGRRTANEIEMLQNTFRRQTEPDRAVERVTAVIGRLNTLLEELPQGYRVGVTPTNYVVLFRQVSL